MLLVLSALSGLLYGQRFAFDQFGRPQGLRNLSVRAIVQDRDGLLWVGTANGLYRFDGYRFRAFTAADGLADSAVACLAAAPEGEVVIGTSLGVALTADGQILPGSFESPEGGPAPVLSGPGCLALTGGGTVHAMTSHGLYWGQLSRNRPLVLRRVPGALAARPGQSVAVDPRRGDVWFSCGESVCRLTAGGVLEEPGVPRGLPSGQWGGLAFDSEGTLWVRDRASAYRLPEGAAHFERVALAIPPAGPVAGIAVDGRGRVWLPTFGGIHTRGRGGRWERYGTPNGLPSDAVQVIFTDREGVTWIGFEGKGLARWTGFPAFRAYQRVDGLSDDAVTALVRGPRGRLWIGTRAGLNRMEEGERFAQWRQTDGLPAESIRAIAPTPDGALWAAPEDAPLFRFEPATGRARRYGPAEGLPAGPPASLLADPDGTLWVAAREGLFVGNALAAQPRFAPYPLPPQLARGAIHRVARAPGGGLWVAGQGGLAFGRSGRWRVYGRAQGLRFDNVARVADNGAGEVWVAYAGPNGASRLRLDAYGRVASAVHLLERAGLTSNVVRFLGADARGRFWVGTDSGIDLFDRGRHRAIGVREGLPSEECGAGAFTAEPDGGVMVGTAAGFLRIHLAEPPGAAVRVPPRVTVLTSGGAAVSPRGGRVNGREVEIGFSDPRLTGDARFRYRLYRSDDATRLGAPWQETGLPSVNLMRIAPGSYVVEVGAMEADGSWGAATSRAEFVVPEAFYDTLWFRAGVFLAAGAVMALIVRGRTRAQREQRRALEAAVEERTRTLSEGRDRIAQQKIAIEALLAEAKETNRLKDEFLANVSHEIRTPMNAVLGMTGLVLETELTSEQRDYLEAAHGSARSLLQLLNDILDLSKIEAGRLDIERVPFPLGGLVEETARPLRLAAAAKGLSLRLDLPAALPAVVLGDPVRLRQILTNLIANAIKFTREGEVSLAVVIDRESDGATWFGFEVRDTGIGIPADKLQIIFERFRQADGSTTREFGGTGLGLAITRRLVELLDGRLSVRSQPGQGSEFRVTLPLPVVAQEAPAPAGPALPPPGRRLAILVAEDNLISQRLVVRLLSKHGHRVTIANHGREAVARFSAGRFDLVLMDVQMPEMDGLAATCEIRRLDAAAGRSTPVVMLTANAMKGDRERCMASGASGYLTKPASEAELLRVIETHVPHGLAASA